MSEGAILLWIQEYLRNPVLTPVMKGVSYLGTAGIFWILLIIALLCFKKTRKVGIVCAVSLLTEFILANLIIKPLAARVRPYEVVQGLICLVPPEKDFSFPSGHAGSSFACAGILIRMTPKKYGISAIVLASLIAVSRLYVGVHYPTDVLCGVLLGLLVSFAVYYIFQKIEAKRAAKEIRP